MKPPLGTSSARKAPQPVESSCIQSGASSHEARLAAGPGNRASITRPPNPSAHTQHNLPCVVDRLMTTRLRRRSRMFMLQHSAPACAPPSAVRAQPLQMSGSHSRLYSRQGQRLVLHCVVQLQPLNLCRCVFAVVGCRECRVSNSTQSRASAAVHCTYCKLCRLLPCTRSRTHAQARSPLPPAPRVGRARAAAELVAVVGSLDAAAAPRLAGPYAVAGRVGGPPQLLAVGEAAGDVRDHRLARRAAALSGLRVFYVM